MKRLILSLSMLLATAIAVAQLRAPERVLAQVIDPSMVVVDRGSKLEVLAMKRAVPQPDATGRVVMYQVNAATADPISPLHMGVVFNHAMQQQGYITGEITIKLKLGHSVAALKSAQYPGLKRITNPEVYVVDARTPIEFLKLLKSLQARSDLEWVEPTVIYGPAAAVSTAQ